MENMPDDKLAELLKRYNEGTCNDEERRLVEDWFEKYKAKEKHVPLNNEGKDAMLRNIMEQLHDDGEPVEEPVYAGSQSGMRRWAVAASILLNASAGGLFWYQQNKRNATTNNIAAVITHDILPGGGGAARARAGGAGSGRN